MPGRRGVRVCLKGRVQGVGFRFFAQRRANFYGLEGYVRNLADGSVEVVAAGEGEKLESFVEELREGPSASLVRDCQVEWMEVPETFVGFSIRY